MRRVERIVVDERLREHPVAPRARGTRRTRPGAGSPGSMSTSFSSPSTRVRPAAELRRVQLLLHRRDHRRRTTPSGSNSRFRTMSGAPFFIRCLAEYEIQMPLRWYSRPPATNRLMFGNSTRPWRHAQSSTWKTVARVSGCASLNARTNRSALPTSTRCSKYTVDSFRVRMTYGMIRRRSGTSRTRSASGRRHQTTFAP